MDAQKEARLRYLLVHHHEEWHAGRTVGRTLYQGWGGAEDLLGIVDTPELAELIVLTHQYAREQLLGETNG